MQTEPLTFHQILSLWKTHSELARDMDVPKERARFWRVRGRLPPKYWPRLLKELHRRFGLTLTPGQLMLAAAADEPPGSDRAEAA
jgi:hypothetical protein